MLFNTIRKPLYSLPLALVAAVLLHAPVSQATHSETAFGEIEARAAPVSLRKCLGGANAGNVCNQNTDCPASSCQDRNIFNMTVAVRFNASAAQLAAIQTAMSNMSASLFDATDGQAELGLVTVVNNSLGSGGDIWISGGGGLSADSGHWANGGRIYAGINTIQFGVNPGEGMAHEFVHLVYDARDEYESRAAGCGAVTGAASCPTLPGEENCLMDQGGVNGGSTELCWPGNHEAALVTEQSRCRSNRSCWEQVAHSWPNTHLMPAGAPDPAAGGAVVDPVVFFAPPAASRIVLVLDNSGSMSLESPSRMARLKTAALDFVQLAVNGTELGIVSFTTTATDQVAIAALGADRSAYINAINLLTPTFRTNIGDGLDHARNMVIAAGGVTSNTAIVLMTDGLNNEPLPNPQMHLNGVLASYMMDSIPVLVTCTGDDLGLASQCEEIATATGGSYVDSADAGDLPESFTHFHELITGGQLVASTTGVVGGRGGFDSYTYPVQPGDILTTVLLQWNDPRTSVEFVVTDPNGNQFGGQQMEQGRFVRVPNPTPGTWRVEIFTQGAKPDTYISRAYVVNPNVGMQATARFSSLEPGKEMTLYAFPRYLVPITNCRIFGLVTLPDGGRAEIELFDEGRTADDTGDDIPKDGVYTNTFRDTKRPGTYSWHLTMDCSAAELVDHHHPNIPPHDVEVIGFIREAMFTTSVNDTQDKDGDGIPNHIDNCTNQFNPDQRDIDGDGIGSICDPDFDNNCDINFLDLGQMKEAFFSNDENTDLDGNGAVNFLDLAIMKRLFFQPPGPSAQPNECSPDLAVRLVNPPTDVQCGGSPVMCTHKADIEIFELNGRDIQTTFSVRTVTDNGLTHTFTVPGMTGGSVIPATAILGPGGNCYNPNCQVTVEVDSTGVVTEKDETNNSDTRLDQG